MSWLQKFPLLYAVLLVLALGLAPWSSGVILNLFGLAPVVPEPHMVEKLRMLSNGTLRAPMDIFDLLMHAAPWVLLVLKLVSMVVPKRSQ